MKNREKLDQIIREKYQNIAGIIVLKSNKTAYEEYFGGYNRDDTIHIASVTKSLLSILVGIAVDQGFVDSIDQKVLDYFPGYNIKRGEKTLQKISIRNLLTMTAPYKFKYEPYTRVYSSNDWTKAALDLLGGRGEIGEFKYTTVGIQVLSGFLAAATGRSVLDFAAENIFIPLGIKVPENVRLNSKEDHLAFIRSKHVSGWVADPRGVNTAGWGLALTTGDMAKIGQLYLNEGSWQGKQLVSSEWIRASVREQSRWGDKAYGYLWWIIDEADRNCFAAIGDGGNVIYVDRTKNMVVAIASRFQPRARDRIELIKKYITPAF